MVERYSIVSLDGARRSRAAFAAMRAFRGCGHVFGLFWRGTCPLALMSFRWFVCLIKRTSFLALRLCCRLHEPILVRSHHNVVTPDVW